MTNLLAQISLLNKVKVHSTQKWNHAVIIQNLLFDAESSQTIKYYLWRFMSAKKLEVARFHHVLIRVIIASSYYICFLFSGLWYIFI